MLEFPDTPPLCPAPAFLGPAFLGVETSLTGRRWVGPSREAERLGLAIAQTTGLPDIVARILALRGVLPEAADAYLAPTLRALMPDPSSLAGMDAAAERLTDAVVRGERIALFGDYDVDGAASVALVLDWLRALGLEATPYIPDRIEEGYGPNVAAMTALARTHTLIICLDCGTTALEPLAAARAAGADVLVLDHHLPGSALPEVQAIVNPSRADCHAGQEALCAAGVAFLTLVATNRTLRTRGFFTAARPEPDLRQGLDLVALATVADVAPLTGLNRAFVRQGLGVLARRQRPGLAALADVARLTAPPTSRDLGFALGPRINAGGRIGEASLGVRLLSSTCPHEAANLAERLDRLNSERRAIEAGVLEAAIAQIEARDPSAPLVWAAAEGWHPGVLGIVASRLKERFNRPALAIGLDETLGRGSGRSVAGVDLGAAVGALAEAGVLLKGGGHAMAAGLTLERPRLDEAMTQLSARLAAQGAGGGGPTDLVLDGALAPGGATVDLVEAMERAGPYGQANPAPRLGFGEVVVQSLRLTANGHALLRLGRAGGRVEAVAFGAGTKGLAPALEAAAATRAPLHVAGRLEIDDWGGRRRAKLRIEDLARP